MFTGIISASFPIEKISDNKGIRTLSVKMDEAHLKNLQIGASVAINGTCLSVTSIHHLIVSFDVIEETLNKTTLGELKTGFLVHVERSLNYGSEIGGHVLSGHIDTTATISNIEINQNNWRGTFTVDQKWMKYILPKGFLGIHGASLTIASIDKKSSSFDVCLIPETLRITTFDTANVGSICNIEIDRQTQAIVDTVERVLASQ